MSLLVAVPDSLIDAANHLARLIGNEGDASTFGAPGATKDGIEYALANFGVVPSSVGTLLATGDLSGYATPEGCDREAAEAAMASVGTDIITIEHAGDALAALAAAGFTLLEFEEE